MLLFLFSVSSLVGCIVANEGTDFTTPSATNFATATIAGLPDLMISNISLEISAEDLCANSPDSYPISIQIKKQGKSNAGPFSIALNDEQFYSASGLPAKQTLDLQIDSPTLDIKVSVDAFSEIAENNESNNRKTVQLSLPTDQAACPNQSNSTSLLLDPIFTLEGHTGKVLSVHFSPDGNLVASGSIDNTLRLWRTTQGSLLRTMRGHPFPVLTSKFSPNGTILATGSTDGLIRIWRVSDGRLLQELTGHAGWVKSLDLSKDGKYLVSCADDFTIRIWRMNDYQLVQTIDEGMSGITDVGFSPDSQGIAWTEDNGVVRLRSIFGSWLHIFSETTLSANALAFDPQGKWLGAGFEDGSIRLWDTQSGQLIQILKSHARAITALEVSPDGKWLASASKDGDIHLWQRGDTGFSSIPSLILSGHTDSITSISISPQSDQLASGSEDYSVRIWQIPQE